MEELLEMNKVSIETITEELKDLPNDAIKQVYDFVGFLKSRQKPGLRNKLNKKILLDVSVWNKDEIDVIEGTRKDINKWNIETY